MNTPTAEEFLNKKQKEYSKGIGNSFKTNYELEKERLIEFAKLHVEAALKEASQKAVLDYGDYIADGHYERVIDESSILNAYPLTNIK